MSAKALHGVTLVLGAAVLWGTTGTGQSFASPALSSLWIGTFRLAIAAGFFGAWWAVRRRGAGRTGGASEGVGEGADAAVRADGAAPWGAILGAAFAMAAYNLAFFAGVRESSVAIGTAIALGSGPLWAGLMQALLVRRLPAALWWGGVGIAASGLALAAGVGSGARGVSGLGIGLCLAAGLSYAVYARCTKAFAARGSIVAVTGLVFGLAACLAAPFAWAFAGVPALAATDVAVVLWLGVAGTGVAYFLFALGLRHVSSATAVALGMAEPVAAVALAVAVVGERPEALAFAGLALVMVGLAVLVRSELGRV